MSLLIIDVTPDVDAAETLRRVLALPEESVTGIILAVAEGAEEAATRVQAALQGSSVGGVPTVRRPRPNPFKGPDDPRPLYYVNRMLTKAELRAVKDGSSSPVVISPTPLLWTISSDLLAFLWVLGSMAGDLFVMSGKIADDLRKELWKRIQA